MAANVAIFWQIITNSSNYFLSSYELDWRQYGNSLALCYIAVAISPAAGQIECEAIWPAAGQIASPSRKSYLTGCFLKFMSHN